MHVACCSLPEGGSAAAGAAVLPTYPLGVWLCVCIMSCVDVYAPAEAPKAAGEVAGQGAEALTLAAP